MTDGGQSETAPTPTRGVPITLDRVRYLRFSLKTLRQIRQEFGVKTLADGLTDDGLGKLLWYGLVQDDPSLTVDQVEDLVDLEQLPALKEALRRAMGQKAKVEILDPRPPATTEAAAPAPASE